VRTPRLINAAFPVVAITVCVLYLLSPQWARLGIVTLVCAVPIAAIGFGMRLNRIDRRGTWLILMLGATLFTIFNYLWFLDLGLGIPVGAAGMGNLLCQVAAYLCVLGAALLVVARHGAGDRGGILDAALIAIGLITPVWEFLLRPHLLSIGAPASTQASYLVKLLLLTATLGALLRIAGTAGTARTAMNYFFVSLATGVVSVVASLLSTQRNSDSYSPLVDLCAMVGYLGMAAAALHPSAREFAQAGGWQRRELTPVSLRSLGFVLALVPLVGSMPPLFGEEPDTQLLSLGTLLVIPLVIMRIGLLLAERTADQEALRFQAHHDELTGLVNRRRFFALLDEAVDQCRRGDLPSIAVLYCDLNKFKIVNDEHGHEAGDHVLRTFAERLTATIRRGDLAARIGGDEFLILCPNADALDAQVLRRRVEEIAALPIPWPGQEFTIGAAVGVAIGTGPDLSGDMLVTAADAEMYTRKASAPYAAEARPA
jgi:diguanylate cyclase (GGDEF)-like protein